MVVCAGLAGGMSMMNLSVNGHAAAISFGIGKAHSSTKAPRDPICFDETSQALCS